MIRFAYNLHDAEIWLWVLSLRLINSLQRQNRPARSWTGRIYIMVRGYASLLNWSYYLFFARSLMSFSRRNTASGRCERPKGV